MQVKKGGSRAGNAYLIKDDDGTFSKDGSRKADELALALAEVAASCVDLGGETPPSVAVAGVGVSVVAVALVQDLG